MAVEEITLSRAYVSDLNEQIAALRKQVAQLQLELEAAKKAALAKIDCGSF